MATNLNSAWCTTAIARLNDDARLGRDHRARILFTRNCIETFCAEAGAHPALIQAETSYARDGISRREREELDTRLDALDARVGNTAYGGGSTVIDNRTRLSNVERALSASGLNAAAQAQVRVEVGDLTRLAAAYERVTPSSDDRSYLDRRIADLETRARVRR